MRNYLKTLAFVIFIHGFFLAGLPGLLLKVSEVPRLLVWNGSGVLPWGLGLWIYVSCVKDFVVVGQGTPAVWDPPTVFVTKGFYKIMRNPMYLGMMLILLGEAILFASAWLLVYALILWLSFHWFVVGVEEPTLRRKFGNSYETYLKSVPRWLPVSRS